MKNFTSHLQHYILSGILLLGNFGVLVNPASPANSAELHEATSAENPDPPTTNGNGDNNVGSSTTEDGDDDTDPPETGEDPEEGPIYDFASDLIIKAANPGYDPGTGSNVGEYIELYNVTNASLVLAGYRLVYTGSGKPVTVFTFPDGSFLTGKHLLLRHNSNKPPELDSDLTYALNGNNGMAQENGKLELFLDDEVVDQVCWTTATDSDDCVYKAKKDTSTIVRDLHEENTFTLIKAADYELPTLDPENPNFIPPSTPDLPPDEDDEPPAPQCLGLEFSEILSYYTNDKSEQFIELFNSTSEEILLDGCQIVFKNKKYDLSGAVASGGYYAYHQSDQFALTKNPTNPLTLTLLDTDGETLDEMAYGKGQKSLTSYARFIDVDGNESWEVTYAITPGQENAFQKFRTCEEGKVINEATGNCIKAPVVSDDDDEDGTTSSTKTLAECPAGQYRNPLTNRCKKIETASTTTLAECPAGQYRNPLTNRCKKIETTSSTTLKECAEGYERNPETNRCRKITSTSDNDGADYALTPQVKSDKTNFVGLGIILLVVAAGLVYVVLQFRREILRTARKARQRIHDIRKNLFSRRIGRDGN